MGADSALAPGPEALEAIQDATHGLGADIVYDCVGNEKALTAAVEYCRSGATLVMIGATSGAVKVSPLAWLGKELTIATSLAHLNHEFPLVIDLMARGRLNTEALVDETIGLGDLEKVLTQLASGLDRVKVLVDARS
ncbi:hypothetical protein AYX19_21580 (plasmid) [Paenarthrobacter ureafaciens]|nr:hypothetical protein AYX22_22205 [Arthrobacter sp. D5-1]QSZ55598.1 hypothetical protein AYX19_21110 [Paenarthrobacter ureafaciens]QSZ55680.1 hypothetical protein AYX19_21580 [Paenarthrobacter ureafaciens]